METLDSGELTSEILLSPRLRAGGVVLGIFTSVSPYDIIGEGARMTAGLMFANLMYAFNMNASTTWFRKLPITNDTFSRDI